MNILIVTGMHRSGTSAVAGELARLGLATAQYLLPGDRYNPKGYFEDPRLIAIHDSVLASFGSNWMDPSPLPNGWLNASISTGYGTQIEQYLAEHGTEGQTLLVKDPRISRLLPLWSQVLSSLGIPFGIVHVYRPCLEVAASLWRRNNIPAAHSFQLWARYNLDLMFAADALKYGRFHFNADNFDLESLSQACTKAATSISPIVNKPVFFDAALPTSNEAIDLNFAHEIRGRLPMLGNPNDFNADNLQALYEIAGGNLLATERRHYAVIHSTLWTVLSEKRELEGKLATVLPASNDEKATSE